ncbi:hypothetical protein CDL12_21970 [Handroanthus impetiginosus]|uniref:Uncharacterized protein n=1 Tax=Handroanthus impetiginosus TaxID=429701 RepID=A0A2G9GJM0_9LAMI|nr:hypothetical protein CDL12_21970 [Handroanthus impetiginosus]
MAKDYATSAIILERCRRSRRRCYCGFQTTKFNSNLVGCREIGRATVSESSIRKNSLITDDKHGQPSSSPAAENYPNILPSSSFHLSTPHSCLDPSPTITADELEFPGIQLDFLLTKAPLKFNLFLNPD